MEDSNCIFCQIVKGKIPCYKIYEDGDYLAFLDIEPYVTGHTMVIPKKHYRWVWDVKDFDKYMGRVRKIVKHFQEIEGKEMVYATIFGEEVAHAHVHIIPGFDNRELGNAFRGVRRMGRLNEEEAKKIIKRYGF